MPGALSAEKLLEQAWDENADPFTRTVKVTIARLRRKLGEPEVIRNTPGVGYRIINEPRPDQGGKIRGGHGTSPHVQG
jgi:DNA-binding response OmpR family regulator